jgi:MFS family permease
MDTLGAVIGPALALLYLYYYPHRYRSLFFIAFIPGAVAILLTFLLRESRSTHAQVAVAKTRFLDFLKYWKASPPAYRQLATGLLFFALFNSSDMFLLLRIKSAGLSDASAIGVYIFYNLVYAAFSYPLGSLGDRIGLKKVFLLGLVVFAAVYFGMAVTGNLYIYFGLFLLYGLYAAATDGISKAWISNIADKKDTATAIGTFTAFQSICTLVASSLAGLVWYGFGPAALFIVAGVAALFVFVYLLLVIRD